MSVEPTTPCPAAGSASSRPTAAALAANAVCSARLSRTSAYGWSSHAWCIEQPAARAPASRHASTRGFSTSSDVMVGDRTYQNVDASCGTMFGFWPPFVNTPWMRSVGRMCWRNAATLTYPSTAASRALRPSQGKAAAWAALPSYTASSCWMAMVDMATRSASAGWIMRAASMPSNAPRRAITILPPPPSSAGVPSTTSRPPAVSATAAAARAAPSPAVAMTLWPHAWPISGSASYSHSTATTGPSPAPAVARNAVATSKAPRSVSSPASARIDVSRSWAWYSSNPSSGRSWMRCEASSRRSVRRSTSSSTAWRRASTSVVIPPTLRAGPDDFSG